MLPKNGKGFEMERSHWTPEQVAKMNEWQHNGLIHPYTCETSEHGPLVATVRGWICPYCDYVQTWANFGSGAESYGADKR